MGKSCVHSSHFTRWLKHERASGTLDRKPDLILLQLPSLTPIWIRWNSYRSCSSAMLVSTRYYPERSLTYDSQSRRFYFFSGMAKNAAHKPTTPVTHSDIITYARTPVPYDKEAEPMCPDAFMTQPVIWLFNEGTVCIEDGAEWSDERIRYKRKRKMQVVQE